MRARTIVPLLSKSANYREWETRQDGERYTIVDDNDTWSLLRCLGDVWIDAPPGWTVDTFLCRYQLVLG